MIGLPPAVIDPRLGHTHLTLPIPSVPTLIGSDFHELHHPDSHAEHVVRGRRLETSYRAGSRDARSLAARGEYVFVADGPDGLKVFDRANVANKQKAQRLVENQNSGFGQKTRVDTEDATAVALPSTVPMKLKKIAKQSVP